MATTDRRGVSVDATDTAIAASPNPGLAVKAPCLVATTGNITLSGLQTVDGVALAAGNRVLVWQQTDATTNGLYNVSTGPWTRTIDADGNDDFASGLEVVVTSGNTYSRTAFQLISADPITLGTSTITFQVASVAAARRINTTAPLAGGGDLTADRTLSINPNGITYGLIQQVAASRLLGNPTGALANLAEIALGATLLFSASTLQTAAMTGDVAAAQNSFATTIQPNVVSNSKFRQSAALSVVGNATNATANVADIAGAANQVLVVNAGGTALGFGTVAYAGIQNVTGSRLLGNPTGAGANISEISLGTTLTFSGSALQTAALTGDVTTAANSFATTIAANAVTYAKFQQVAASSLVGNPTGALANAQGVTLGATLAFSGSSLQTAAMTGDVTSAANSFATTIAANAVTNAKLAAMAAWTFKANATSGSATPTDITIDGLTLKASPAAGDELMIWDVAGAAVKKATVSSISSAGSVSSIAGNTGAFTLGAGLTNSVNVLLLDPSYHLGCLGGLVLSNDGTTPATVIDISQGIAASDDFTVLMKGGALTKNCNAAWAVGGGNGALDSGVSLAVSTWYYFFAIMRTDTGIVDFLLSTSPTSPTMPASYTKKRYIGAIRTDASAHIIAFSMVGDTVYWNADDAGGSAFVNTTIGTAASLKTATVPPGFKVEAILRLQMTGVSGITNVLVSPPDQSDQPPASVLNFSADSTNHSTIELRVRTNASAQVRMRSGVASTSIYGTTAGWVDLQRRFNPS